MDRIKLLYAAMNTRQRNSLKGFLGLFHRGDPKDDKQLLLLRLIDRDPDLEAATAAQKLYEDPKSKAFLMLALRVYERMTEFFCSSLNTDLSKYDRELPYLHGLIEYRRHMLTANVFQGMEQHKLAIQHMNQARDLAAACCAPELESDVLLRLRGTFDRHDQDYTDIDEALGRSLQGATSDVKALGVYHGFIHDYMGRTGSDSEKVAYLQEHLPQLDAQLSDHPSVRGSYYTNLLKIHLATLVSDHAMGAEAAQLAIEVMENHQGMRSPERMSEPYVQLGLLEIHVGQYASAVEHLTKGRSFLKEETLAYCSCTTALCYAWVYVGEYDQARASLEVLHSLRDAPYFKKSRLLDGLQDYLEACMAYFDFDLSQAWRYMQVIQPLLQDREGWGTGLRIFEVMILVELEVYEVAETRVEALRKHISKYPPAAREVAIYNLFRHLAHSFFDIKADNKAAALLSAIEETTWDPFGHEVIRVDEWYRKQVGEV